ncbi:hypothetical protein OHT59_32115 [Streptomyces sp. NBC_00243]|uniref:hypothetical protein n=1 Tax=Streptomyces sp. NBC_00243 TaxID=2975688 RepID=UPI002DD92DEC|nr:hypothetical protein [Streptomyces sp. NBC_00243]WRZ22794.1 hypothetical protein OHT59_32115 [Streptomyces sp. NBC_00243]
MGIDEHRPAVQGPGEVGVDRVILVRSGGGVDDLGRDPDGAKERSASQDRETDLGPLGTGSFNLS